MAHHLDIYPVERYFSDTYQTPSFKESTPKFFAVAAIPILLLPVICWFIGLLPLSIMLISILEMLLIGAINYYVHDWFHVRNHRINKVPVLKSMFKKWNYLHYLHHVDMTKNYGIYSFFWDKRLKSYWKNETYKLDFAKSYYR
jgi:sterol desaturase/sphingolipid hydroxylase (fatty acid hydroxylase superfamily)